MAKQLDELVCHLVRTEVGLGPGHIVLDGDPAPPWKLNWKGAQQPPPNFLLMSVVAKQLDGSECHLVQM